MIHRNRKSYIALFFTLLAGACPKTSEKPSPGFAFDEASHEVAFTAGTYKKAVDEKNKPADDKRDITYTSSNSGIATVDNAGVVIFKTAGIITITASKAAESGYAKATASYILYITIKPAIKASLVAEIQRAMAAHGNEVNLNYIDTSGITDMSRLFSVVGPGHDFTAFRGDISDWDVSGVTDMSNMFHDASAFNQDISKWNVSKVTNMLGMFFGATAFNQDISDWDVSSVTHMASMFNGATSFDQDISKWDVLKVTRMNYMFYNARAFNRSPEAWARKLNVAIKADNWFHSIGMFRGSGLAISLPSWCENVPACKSRQQI